MSVEQLVQEVAGLTSANQDLVVAVMDVKSAASTHRDEALDYKGAAQVAKTAAENAMAAAEGAAGRAAQSAEDADGFSQLTEADREATGLDRIATAEDRVATGLDREATGLDREATGLDREAAELAKDEAVAAASAAVIDPLRRAVESASGGRMTVLYTASGQPSHMHVFPAFNLEDVAPGGELGTGLHPAFLFDGVAASEIFVGAYQASTSKSGGAAVSLPGVDPRNNINFDAARNLCKANGPGWDMMSNLDWAAIALWCMANGYEPRGNTQFGRSHVKRWETGRRQDGLVPGVEGTARTLAGSGPDSWSHDGSPAGIHDLVGNVWEWVGGLKMVDGRVWLAPDNGLNEEVQYIDSGFDMPATRAWSTVDATAASELVKQSLIAPASPALSPVGQLYTNLEGERLPSRGGAWDYAGSAGLAALNLGGGRASSGTFRGFRPRFRAP